MRNFATRLAACETGGNHASETSAAAVLQIFGKLRLHLAPLTGNAGFRALLSRAVALASPEVPWLPGVNVKSDGSLEGLDKLDGQYDPKEIAAGRVILLAQLLGLLVAFIGETLTLRMLRDLWPQLSRDDLDLGRGNGNEKAN